MNVQRYFLPFIALFLLAALRCGAQAPEFGETHFPNSGSEEAQNAFVRGLLLLHSFEYDDARDAFVEARETDPSFAMAYWGEAMTYNHPVWFSQSTEKARAALQRLAPTLAERVDKAPSEREKDYLRAVDKLFFGGSKKERDFAYSDAMSSLRDRYPDDLEAAVFYALSLLGCSHGGRDYRLYMRAAAVAEEVFARNPKHPGAAHYLIHSYDDPVHAPVGLRAARVYADIAPAASHALHMPSHIFVAMGMWDDVVRSNKESFAASDARVERKNLDVSQRGYHALWWLAYGQLQQGRFADAREALRVVEDDVSRGGSSSRMRNSLIGMRAAYLIDSEDWTSDAGDIVVDLEGIGLEWKATDHFTLGLVGVKTGDEESARQHLKALLDLTKGSKHESKELGIATVLRDELKALLLIKEGNKKEGLDLLREAAAMERGLVYDFGPPSPVKPASELLGDMLLHHGYAKEAQKAYGDALERAPKRARSLLGLTRAAARVGDVDSAKRAHIALREIWHTADQDPMRILQDTATLGIGIVKKSFE